jgi:hypothetical protein
VEAYFPTESISGSSKVTDSIRLRFDHYVGLLSRNHYLKIICNGIEEDLRKLLISAVTAPGAVGEEIDA